MARSTHGTRADDTFATMRADILAGRLAPGEKLKFPELGARYGVGVGVLREALTRLAEQDLVRSQPHQGFQVTPLSAADLTDLTAARVAIECLVLRMSLAEGDTPWESDLVAKHHTLERTPQYDQDDPERVSDAWSRAHADFHHTLLAGCRNSRLLSIANSLRDSAELYRSWSQQHSRHPGRDVIAEHRTLMELALARETEAAVAALARHISHTTEILLDGDRSSQLDDGFPGTPPELLARMADAERIAVETTL
ncbi:GntR family transcriptional regulator [Amycolatopsis orientalis]|uniref:GntR family transcriptional regulator n=1 Tax=Amycolatopsis orientalis TaxID=31958 RepID=UPI0003A2B7E1|nr:GntR family transcriptional regulator [Amycolatopsis orientalis]